MLPSNLLVTRTRKGKITPIYVPLDRENLDFASQLIETYQTHIGRKKSEVYSVLDKFETSEFDYRLVRGYCVLLERSCVFEIESSIPPSTARKAVFEETRQYPLIASKTLRRQVVEKVSETFGVTPHQLEESLWSDLDEELVLKDFSFITPEDLIRRYNLSLLQTILFRATGLEVNAKGGFKQVFRRIKQHGLMYSLEKQNLDYRLYLDGPISLFKMTEKYGTSLALLIPEIIAMTEWSIKANIISGERRSPRLLLLEADYSTLSDRIIHANASAEGEYIFDSKVEEEFAHAFQSMKTGWVLRREPDLLEAGRYIMIPDFSFEKDGRKVYLEVVGFWTEEYLRRKLQKLGYLRTDHMLIAVDERLSCSQLRKFKEKVIFFKKKVPVKPIFDYLRKLEATMVQHQIERLKSIELLLKGDIVDIKNLAEDLKTSREAAERYIRKKPVKGYRLIGDQLVSNRKLDVINEKLSQLTSDKFSSALKVIEAEGVNSPNTILSDLGYIIEWHGLDLDTAIIKKRK